LPRRNDRDNDNLRPRPSGGGAETGAVARLIHELKYQARRAERSEARPDGHEQLGTNPMISMARAHLRHRVKDRKTASPVREKTGGMSLG
jgi:hypothetical protein